MRIFIVGPGGVGKTTAGKLLADKMKYVFIDLDQQFTKSIGNIGEYIDMHGYEAYCYRNSALFQNLLKQSHSKTIMALSSGFLVHENLPALVKLHKKLISEKGRSLLLLPNEDPIISAEIVVERQIARGFGDVTPEKRHKGVVKYINRHKSYLNTTDYTLYNMEIPEVIAEKMFAIFNNISKSA